MSQRSSGSIEESGSNFGGKVSSESVSQAGGSANASDLPSKGDSTFESSRDQDHAVADDQKVAENGPTAEIIRADSSEDAALTEMESRPYTTGIDASLPPRNAPPIPEELAKLIGRYRAEIELLDALTFQLHYDSGRWAQRTSIDPSCPDGSRQELDSLAADCNASKACALEAALQLNAFVYQQPQSDGDSEELKRLVTRITGGGQPGPWIWEDKV